jgi:hypothetical protein
MLTGSVSPRKASIHTWIYIYIYIWRERESGEERRGSIKCECTRKRDWNLTSYKYEF